MSAIGPRSPRTQHKVVSERVTASLQQSHPEFYTKKEISRDERDRLMKSHFDEWKKNRQLPMRFNNVSQAMKKQELMSEIRRAAH